jgi:hypothetical protein
MELLQKLGFQTVAGMEIWYAFRGINTKLDYKVKIFNAEVDSDQN